MDVSEVADRLEIADVIRRCVVSWDDGDWETHAACYWPEATIEVDPPAGEMDGQAVGREVIVSSARERWAALQPIQRHHMITNTLIDIDLGGDRAIARSYILLGSSDVSGFQILHAGRYVDELEKRDGRWRYSRRTIRLGVKLS